MRARTATVGKSSLIKVFFPYYRRLYGLVEDLSNEGLIDSFWILNGTIEIRESSQSKPVSITHESDLQF